MFIELKLKAFIVNFVGDYATIHIQLHIGGVLSVVTTV